MPLPRRRKIFPLWVSAGILIVATPSSVGISIEPPSAAVLKLIGISQCRSLWSRWKTACGLILITTYKSPEGPPFTPCSPSPDKRILSSLSTPDGIFTDSVLCCLIRPLPLQSLHGEEIIFPLPWQRGQVCCIEKKPCCIRTCPCPPQVVQCTGLVPGFAPEPWQVSHSAIVGMRICVSVPRAACSSVISML